MFELHLCEKYIYICENHHSSMEILKVDWLLRYFMGKWPNVCPTYCVNNNKIRPKLYNLGIKLRNYNMQTKTF